MPKIALSGILLEGILERVPEGFVHSASILRRFRSSNRRTISQLQSDRSVRDGEFWYLPERITLEQYRAIRNWARPELPEIREGNIVIGETIEEKASQRERFLNSRSPDQEMLLQNLKQSDGYIPLDSISISETEMQELKKTGFVKVQQDILYDPLRLGNLSISEVLRRRRLSQLSAEVTEFLEGKTAQTAPQQEVATLIGEDALKELLGLGGISRFSVPIKRPPYAIIWIRTKHSNFQEAQAIALEATRIPDTEWAEMFSMVGERPRLQAREGKTARSHVLAHTYTVTAASKRLSLHGETIQRGISENILTSFIDPEGVQRISANLIEGLAENPEQREVLAGLEMVKARELALVLEMNYMTVRRRMKREGFSRPETFWRNVRGKWNLPSTFVEFRVLFKEKLVTKRAEREQQHEIERQQQEQDRLRRRELRERLVAAFPTWQHDGRADQRILLHIGPPNSGKTYDALQSLAQAEHGWYLAPLRLLAFEVFERLNRMGVRCNLLTGEEYISVDGATVTAATIEMFNPSRSGDCVVIDEAQMLADPDRGWAWTRALMEAQSATIHVLAPPTARSLIERMASSAAMPLTTIKHERLAPIRIASAPWKLRQLPERTILVAFSRQAVLELKTRLETWKRTVSVVYGSLPPEVRRKQADRFADEVSEICIATDAVGMGLNLPADNVCFYDIRKYDGRSVRLLLPSEVQQIGGRAGRYGLSRAGEIGATSRDDLVQVQKLFYATPTSLTHARVAPTVADLELIPGTLARRLSEWAILKSIPESLKGAIETADLTERIELAGMLSDSDEKALGLAASLQLVNAPTRQSSRVYWYECSRAIIQGSALPLPPISSAEIVDAEDLDRLETYISYADIYLWLSNRREFEGCAPDADEVRLQRGLWSEAIDRALLRKLKMSRYNYS